MNSLKIIPTERIIKESTISYENIPKIRVIIRKRPLSKKEQSKNEKDVIDIKENKKVIVKEKKQKVDLTKYIEEHQFIFDLAYDQDASNEKIYLETVRPMIEAAFNKIKVTCFAYGQTGSGKTYTMMGVKNKIPGLYLFAAHDIFSILNNYDNLSIWVSFYEIYCGKLYDLLNGKKMLTAREDGKQNICIVGLTEKNVENLDEMMKIIEYGLSYRVVGITGANADSSRSHGIIQIVIKDEKQKQYGKISFIDLAGSERAIDTIDTNKQTKFDGAEINKSLLALKECIRALDQEKKHTPFRGSKLTLVLRDSFIGNCKTLMIGNISPSSSSSEHTLNTLRYADRVKELRAKQQNNNLTNIEMSPKVFKPHKVDIPIKYGFNIKTGRNSRNNSKKNTINKSMNICEKNNNLDGLNNLNCYKGRNKNKICSEKAISKDTLNISGINFFNNIPAIKITKKTIFNSNDLAKDNDENNIDKNNCFSRKDLRNTCTVSSNILDFNSMGKNEKENNGINSIIKTNINFNSPKEKQIKFDFDNDNNDNVNNENEEDILSDDNSINNNNNLKGLKKKKSGCVGFQFLNNYQNFKDKKNKKNKKVSFENAIYNEELEELKKRKKAIELSIINEKNSCIEMHKNHIDYIVNLMKKEMNYIDVVEEKSNIKTYVEQMMKIFNLEELKIEKIKKNFSELNSILKEKEEIDKKIKLFVEQNETKDDSTNCVSNINFNSSGSGLLSANNSQLGDVCNENDLSHSITDDNTGSDKKD